MKDRKKKKIAIKDFELIVSHVAEHQRYFEKQVHLHALHSPTGTSSPGCNLFGLVQSAKQIKKIILHFHYSSKKIFLTNAYKNEYVSHRSHNFSVIYGS